MSRGFLRVSFTDKAAELAEKYPDMLPKYVQLVEFESEMRLVHGLWALITQTKELGEFLNDTRIKIELLTLKKPVSSIKKRKAQKRLALRVQPAWSRNCSPASRVKVSRMRRAPMTALRQKSRRKAKFARVS
jgi:hypothetical protein